MFEALCDEGTICLKPYVMKVNKQKVIKILFQPKKRRKIHGSVPTPLTGFLFLIAPVFKYGVAISS